MGLCHYAEKHVLTITLLITLHIFAGIAAAGVGLATSTIGLKLAPRDQATSYLSGISLSLNIGAGLGPLAGGLLADFFNQRQFSLNFIWTSPAHSMQFQALSITGFSFLFVIALFLGLITLGVLANLREEGEASRDVVLESLLTPMRELYRPLPHHHYYFQVYRYLKRIPLPGLDVALSVAAYEIASFSRVVFEFLNWWGRTLRRGILAVLLRLSIKLNRTKE